MKKSGNTVLITGGASGIGFAFAERFARAGNEVIVCGRREDKLQEAKQKLPQLHTRVCDVSVESERRSLVEWATAEFPKINVLVNNAGIQQRVNLLDATEDWSHYRRELTINLDAPIHLSMLCIPHLLSKPDAAIVNVSSGLALTPAAWVPIYSATKAGLHSFSMTLRLQLARTSVRVVEIFPPAVNTDLGGVGLHTFGAPVNDFADSVFERLMNGESEIGYGGTDDRLRASKDEIDDMARQMWERMSGNRS